MTYYDGNDMAKDLFSVVQSPYTWAVASVVTILKGPAAAAALGIPTTGVWGSAIVGVGIGHLLDMGYTKLSGQSLGEDIYDFVNQDEVGTRWYKDPDARFGLPPVEGSFDPSDPSCTKIAGPMKCTCGKVHPPHSNGMSHDEKG